MLNANTYMITSTCEFMWCQLYTVFISNWWGHLYRFEENQWRGQCFYQLANQFRLPTWRFRRQSKSWPRNSLHKVDISWTELVRTARICETYDARGQKRTLFGFISTIIVFHIQRNQKEQTSGENPHESDFPNKTAVTCNIIVLNFQWK